MFEYECPKCGEELEGDFGDDVTCVPCGVTYETEWDYSDCMEGNMSAWIVGVKE